jgi:hypothetical protein
MCVKRGAAGRGGTGVRRTLSAWFAADAVDGCTGGRRATWGVERASRHNLHGAQVTARW